MKSTKVLSEIIMTGVGNYLLKHKGAVENIGEPLLTFDETSVMLNCYTDEETGEVIPLYEFENEGHITQFDSFEEALDSFIKHNKGGIGC